MCAPPPGCVCLGKSESEGAGDGAGEGGGVGAMFVRAGDGMRVPGPKIWRTRWLCRNS